jgi:CheY-like chemotaxis protein
MSCVPPSCGCLRMNPGSNWVAEATSFAETLQLAAGLKPDVLLLDLHMRDEREYSPELVKSQILLHTKCVVAISLYNDDDARALAESFGAHVLLDKMKLYSELIPAIKQFCPSVSIARIAEPLGKSVKRPSTPSIVSGEAA